MTYRRLLATTLVAFAAQSGSIAPAMAQEGTQDDFMILFKMSSVDKNKDGMVSKQEVMAMLEKAYEMKAKAMGTKDGRMTEAQMREFLKSLYVGG